MLRSAINAAHRLLVLVCVVKSAGLRVQVGLCSSSNINKSSHCCCGALQGVTKAVLSMLVAKAKDGPDENGFDAAAAVALLEHSDHQGLIAQLCSRP